MTFSLLWGTGFEEGLLIDVKDITWSSLSHCARSIISGGVGGSYCLQHYEGSWIFGSGNSWYYTLPISQSDIYFGEHIYPDDGYDGTNIFFDTRLMVGTDYYSIKWSNSVFYVTRNGSAVYTSSNLYPKGNWYHIEMHYKVSDTVGIIESWIDGVLVYSFSGDTKIGAGTEITIIYTQINAVRPHLLQDNIYIGTGERGREIKFSALRPNADSSTAWIPSSGSSNYACIDESPTSIIDYISSSSTDMTDIYELSNFDATAKSIQGIVVSTYSDKSGSSGSNVITPLVQIGETQYSSASINVTTTAIEYRSTWATNPDTLTGWVEEDLNSLLMGVKNEII